jgi:hypothetical protein
MIGMQLFFFGVQYLSQFSSAKSTIGITKEGQRETTTLITQ